MASGAVRMGLAVAGLALTFAPAFGFLPSPTRLGWPSAWTGPRVRHAGVKPEGQPRAARTSMSAVGGKVLVSGFLDSKQRTDQFVFDVLHAQGTWDKIVAFSHDNAFARKRLISRKSRYSGLLDKLEFDEGDRSDAAAMKEKLAGCDAWLCFNADSSTVKDQVEAAKAAGVNKMVITSSVSAESAQGLGIEEVLEASGLSYTFIRTGDIVDGREGGPVTTTNFTDALPSEEVVRDDIVRLCAEAFFMGNATNKAFSFGTGDDTAADYLKELRQKGLDRREEMDVLISGGLEIYKVEKAAEIAEKNKPPETPEEAAERERKLREERKEEYDMLLAEARAKQRAEYNEKVKVEQEKIMEREWSSQYWSQKTELPEKEWKEVEANRNKAWKKAKKMVDAKIRGDMRTPDDLDETPIEVVDDDDDDDDEEEEPEVTASAEEAEEDKTEKTEQTDEDTAATATDSESETDSETEPEAKKE